MIFVVIEAAEAIVVFAVEQELVGNVVGPLVTIRMVVLTVEEVRTAVIILYDVAEVVLVSASFAVVETAV